MVTMYRIYKRAESTEDWTEVGLYAGLHRAVDRIKNHLEKEGYEVTIKEEKYNCYNEVTE